MGEIERLLDGGSVALSSKAQAMTGPWGRQKLLQNLVRKGPRASLDIPSSYQSLLILLCQKRRMTFVDLLAARTSLESPGEGDSEASAHRCRSAIRKP
jgi:hypothetical protein